MTSRRSIGPLALAACLLAAGAGADEATEPKKAAPRATVRPPSAEQKPAAAPQAGVLPDGQQLQVTPPGQLMPAPEPTMPAGPAGILEVAQTTFDAGSVERGTKVVHAFELKNVGEHDLTVDAKPG